MENNVNNTGTKININTNNKEMNKMTNKFDICPKCESKKVNSIGTGVMIVSGVVTMSVFFWLLIIPLIGIVGMLAGLGLILISPLFKGMLMCKDCNHVWKRGEEF